MTPNRAFLSDEFVRKLKAYGQSELSRRYKVKRRTLDGWVRGHNKAPRDHEELARIAEYVGCPRERMFL